MTKLILKNDEIYFASLRFRLKIGVPTLFKVFTIRLLSFDTVSGWASTIHTYPQSIHLSSRIPQTDHCDPSLPHYSLKYTEAVGEFPLSMMGSMSRLLPHVYNIFSKERFTTKRSPYWIFLCEYSMLGRRHSQQISNNATGMSTGTERNPMRSLAWGCIQCREFLFCPRCTIQLIKWFVVLTTWIFVTVWEMANRSKHFS